MSHSEPEQKMTDWQQRVIDERDQLNVKVHRLEMFILSANFQGLERQDQILLNCQLSGMRGYLSVLDLRIERFR